jgi:hypothetical protein
MTRLPTNGPSLLSPNSTVVAQPTSTTPAVSANEPPQQLERALELGKLFAQLRFFGQQIWLWPFCAHPHEATIKRLFSDIHFAAGNCVGSEHRQQIQEFVAAVERRWQEGLGSEWHSEERYCVNQETAVAAVDETEVNWQNELHARYATNLVAELRQHISRLLSGPLQRAFDLGTKIDEAQHRPDVFRFMLERPAAEEPRGLNLFGSGSSTSQPSTPSLHWRFFEPGELPPPENWSREVIVHWEECELPTSQVAEHLVNVDQATSVNAVVGRIEQAFASAVREASRRRAPRIPPPPGYLGLILDESRGELRREGYPDPVPIDPRKIPIVRLLLQNRDSRTSMNMLQDISTADGYERSQGTIYNEISELRTMLRPLGLSVGSRSRVGWLLEEQGGGGAHGTERLGRWSGDADSN